MPYRQIKPEVGKRVLSMLIDEIGAKAPAGLLPLKRLGTTLKRRKADVLAHFDHVGRSNGRTEVLTVVWSTCGVSRWGSGIWCTISRGHHWKLAGLDHDYTLNPEEPLTHRFDR